MNAKLRNRIILSLAFGAVIFLALTIFADSEKLVKAFASFNWAYAPLILGCVSMNFALRYMKWDYYTLKLDVRPEPKKNMIFFFMAFTMAVTPGKFGEVLKSYLLKQENQTPISKSAPIVLAERLTDFIGLIILILVGAYVFQQSRLVVMFIAFAFAAITVLLSWRKGSMFFIEMFARVPFVKKYVAMMRTAYESIYTLLRPGTLIVTTLMSIASWFFECLAYWLVVSVFNAPIDLLKATFIYAFATVIGAISMIPGGLGTTEGSLTGLAVLAGTPADIAVASTVIIRVATLWFAVFIGIVVTLGFQKSLNVDLDTLPMDKASLND